MLLDGANQSVISCHVQNHGASNFCHDLFTIFTQIQQLVYLLDETTLKFQSFSQFV